jgi:Holliday junction resolvase RusA-like endonuclease
VSLRFEHAPGVVRPDVDAYQKVLLDALKTAGCIRNDSPVWIILERTLLERGPRNRTVITLEDL